MSKRQNKTTMYRMIQQWKESGITWLKDVLTRLPNHKANKLHELLTNSRKSLSS